MLGYLADGEWTKRFISGRQPTSSWRARSGPADHPMLTRPPSESAFLFKKTPKLVRFVHGRSIYGEGDPAVCWFEVRSGLVRTCRFYPQGDRHVLEFIYPGQAFGLARPAREETAEAVCNVELCMHVFSAASAPNYAQDGEALQAALHITRNCLFLLGHRTAEQRLAAFLLTLAERLGTGVQVPVPMSRADIADHLRLTIHTVSRTISHLCRQGLIELKSPQSFEIVDEAGLRRVAGEGSPSMADSAY
jgi:CRP/FNR family transcriptional regulator/CRP/FNR family nitrogen fixation transcriptional regulator